MENKKKVKIEFWRKSKYYVEVELTEQQFNVLEEYNGGDVDECIRDRETGEPESNEAFEILREFAMEENECDWDNELEDFEMEEVE